VEVATFGKILGYFSPIFPPSAVGVRLASFQTWRTPGGGSWNVLITGPPSWEFDVPLATALCKTFLLRILNDSWAGHNPQGLQCRLKKKKQTFVLLDSSTVRWCNWSLMYFVIQLFTVKVIFEKLTVIQTVQKKFLHFMEVQFPSPCSTGGRKFAKPWIPFWNMLFLFRQETVRLSSKLAAGVSPFFGYLWHLM